MPAVPTSSRSSARSMLPPTSRVATDVAAPTEFAFNARISLHVRVLYAGRDAHHIVEGQFKALARALRQAVAIDPRVTDVPSTKGAL